MNKHELIKIKIDTVCRAATLIPIYEAKELVDEIYRMEGLMPILDPSSWIRISNTIGGHKGVAEAFLMFRVELEKIKEKEND